MSADIRVCESCGEPMVFTFEFSGFEYKCQACGHLEGIFGKRVDTSPVLVKRLDELTQEYERDYAERKGRLYEAPKRIGDPGVTTPKCKTCGKEPEVGTAVSNSGGKPNTWFSREIDGIKEYACSSDCIPSGEMRLPW